MGEVRLTEAERESLLKPCECGHTINDHGSMGTCWTCSDEGKPDCRFHFEDLLTERIEAIIVARLARVEALADEWERMGVTSVYESSVELAQILRAALTDQPASDHPAEAL